MKLSLRIVLSEIVPILLALAMVSAGTAQAGSNHRVSWNTYETRHFKIVWHQDVKPQADIAKDFLEEAYARIGKDLGLRDRGIPITVVLTGLPDESNGYATPLGHRIVIFTRPGQVIATGEIAWLKRVLAHELTHQLTFLALRKSFLGIYSELYKTSHLPSWFVEGVAQFEAETWDAKRNTFFAHALYNSALEPYPNLATYTKADPVSSRLVYEQGHAFVRFLMAKEGRGFLGPLLKRIRVIPVWSEIKALLSPLTASMLPLESALRAKTGLSYKALYREFLDSMQVGLPKGYRLPGEPLAGGVPGFAIVFQIKRIDSASFLFTGQKEWDQPYVSLFVSRGGKVERIGPSYVNPVFDLSEDGKRLLYVRTYSDRDRDPVDKLFLRDLGTGSDRFVSDGAAHPIFLGPDSIAFSRYRKGRQALVLCSLPGADPACIEVAQDSMVGVYGLSRSARGILCNTTDTSGRTGIHEYSAGTGFTRLFQDTVPAEFPVEANDGSVWMIRERGGLMQVDSWNRLTGLISPVADFPLGTFYLHRAAPGVIASVAQTGSQGNWGFMPVKLQAPVSAAADADPEGLGPVPDGNPTIGGSPDSTRLVSPVAPVAPIAPVTPALPAPSTAQALAAPAPAPDSAYVAPRFLSKLSPALITGDSPPVQATASRYNSLLEMRPLILYPTLVQDFPLTNFGGGALMEDPLELHSLSVNLAWLSESPGYDMAYTNRQTPVEVTVVASNLLTEVDEARPEASWSELFLVERTSVYSLQLGIPAPWDMPMPHHLFLGLKAEAAVSDFFMAGAMESGSVKRLSGWSRRESEAFAQIFLGYFHSRPYAYNFVHPLLLTDLEAGYVHRFPDQSPAYFWYARQTFPLIDELTYTLRYSGRYRRLENRAFTADLPDGGTRYFYRQLEQGYGHFLYSSLDFPLYKGFIAELPVFGLWNYIGASCFGEFRRSDYEDRPGEPGTGYDSKNALGGAKVNLLFHVMRRLPFAISQALVYNFDEKSMEYRSQVEFAGVPGSFDILSGRRREFGSGRNGRL